MEGATKKTEFFFDACISHKLVAMLNLIQSEDDIFHIRSTDGFNDEQKDLDWIPEVAKRGYVLVTCDNAQRRKIEEKILRESVRISSVFFPEGFAKLTRWPQAQWVINHWESISRDTRHCKQGETFLVKMNGKVERFVPKKK